MYVRQGIVVTNTKITIEEYNYWCIFTNVQLGNNKINLGIVYHSPNGNHGKFINDFEEICDKTTTKNQRLVIVGDFNFDYLVNNFYRNKIQGTIMKYGLEQIINEPTRCTPTSETLIDYVITNDPNIFAKVHKVPKITDHDAITINIRSNNRPVNVISKMYRNYNIDNFHMINLRLIDCSWPTNCIDVNTIFDKTSKNFKKVVDEICPVKTFENSRNSLPWYDKEIHIKAKNRDNAYKNFIQCSRNVEEKQNLWNIYKIYRNEVNNSLRLKRKHYYENAIDSHYGDSKQMWKTLKQLIRNENLAFTNPVIKFEFSDRVVIAKSENDIANCFNEYFISSVGDIIDTINNHEKWSANHLPEIKNNLENFSKISLKELKNIIASLENKGNIHDVMNGQVIKNTIDTCGFHLLNLINTSFSTGIFPNELKTSIIIPIPKVKNSNDAMNFRPINTLLDIEKVIERAAYNQLIEHININNIFLGNQSGFRSKHSCETALQLTVTSWNQLMDKGKYIVAVFIDLKRAFETIDRGILLQKLKSYGIKSTALKWLESYLSDRKQVVKINNHFSTKRQINIGVPQGSVIGPLLFILYLNDINCSVNCEFINLYADDTLLAVSGDCVETSVQKMNDELINLEKYLRRNKLKINVQKTKAMIISNHSRTKNVDKDNITLIIENKKIEIVKQFKYLGVVLDENLTYKEHFITIQKKISKKLFFFSRIAAQISMKARLTVFNSIIQPHFDYCSTILFLLDNTSKASLQKLQNRGMRLILKCNRYTPITHMLETLQWQSVTKRLTFSAMIFIFKIVKGLMPTYFKQFIKFNHEVHEHCTRSANNFHIDRSNTSKGINSLFVRGLVEYNSIPNEIKACDKLVPFKRELSKYL